jgi:multimeric flavodoxin WrbA
LYALLGIAGQAPAKGNEKEKEKMKVLLINGSPHKDGCTFTALNEVAKTLEKNGIESEILYLGVKPIAGCIACGKCFDQKKCVFDDKVNEILTRCDEFDGLVIGSPVYYAGPSGQLRAFLDRLFYAGGWRFAGKPGAAVVSCRRGGATAAFDQLNKYFTISSMPIVSSQYWNQVHGAYAEQVFQDEEGLQTMRTLGNNMAWLLKCIQLGKENGITLPEREPHLWTNFVR